MKKIMYRLMLIGLLLLFGTKAKAVQEADNVLYLPFDEGEGKTAKDASPHKNDGIFQGNAKWAKGKYGNSLSLDGDKGGLGRSARLSIIRYYRSNYLDGLGLSN